jgi:hypothetical protein
MDFRLVQRLKTEGFQRLFGSFVPMLLLKRETRSVLMGRYSPVFRLALRLAITHSGP